MTHFFMNFYQFVTKSSLLFGFLKVTGNYACEMNFVFVYQILDFSIITMFLK